MSDDFTATEDYDGTGHLVEVWKWSIYQMERERFGGSYVTFDILPIRYEGRTYGVRQYRPQAESEGRAALLAWRNWRGGVTPNLVLEIEPVWVMETNWRPEMPDLGPPPGAATSNERGPNQ